MSVPSSPQNEAIQHSSISTSNGVSSSTAATAPLASGPALGPAADHSTEEEDDSHVGGASSSHTQSSGSWSGLWLVTLIPGSHVEMREIRDVPWNISVWSPLHLSSFQSSAFLQRVSTAVGERHLGGYAEVVLIILWFFHLWCIYLRMEMGWFTTVQCVQIRSEETDVLKHYRRLKDGRIGHFIIYSPFIFCTWRSF